MRINAITIAITMVLATASLAAKTPTFLKSNDSRSIILHLNAWKSDKIVVSIKDMAGVTVFSEKIQNPSGNRKYDLSGLAQGQYGFVVEDGLKLAEQTLVITNEGVVVNPSTAESFRPVFKTDANIWKVQGLALNQTTEVAIFDENGNKVFNEKIEKPVVERAYDVSRLDKGNYTIEYSNGNDTFTHRAIKK